MSLNQTQSIDQFYNEIILMDFLMKFCMQIIHKYDLNKVDFCRLAGFVLKYNN